MQVVSNFSVVLLAFAVSLNIHRERIVKNSVLLNRFFLASACIVFLVSLIFLFNRNDIFSFFLPSSFLYAMVFYSMVRILKGKPDRVIVSDDKTEKRNAIIVIVVLLISLAGILLTPLSEMVRFANTYGGFVLSVICILLTISKINTDIRRLSAFTKPAEIEWANLGNYNITPRESEVIQLILKGRTNKEIGEELFISLPTVKTHVSRIFEKLKVRNRLELSNCFKSK